MSAVRRARARLLAYGQYGFPFLPGPAPTPTTRLRRLSGPAHLPRRRRWLRPLAFTGMLLAWPVGALHTAIRLQSAESRPGRWGRILDSWRLALTRNVPPFDYRAYRLDEPGPRAALPHYLFWTDLPALAALNARRGAVQQDVQDKARFAEICAAHDLPAVPTLAAFRGGRQVAPATPFVPVGPEIWVKSLDGQSGQGAALWQRVGDAYRNAAGRVVPAAGFGGHVRARDCIVQPRLANHPVVAAITNGALASLRIVTGIDRDGHAAMVSAILYLPCGDRAISVAGIGCAIDPGSGALTRALHFGKGAGEIGQHPDTGEPIVGRCLPFWSECRALAVRAHGLAFARFAFLGWDIAITPEGPLLLEANSGWAALHLQLLNGPLGLTDFSRILEDHV